MKRWIAFILGIVMLTGLLGGCGQKTTPIEDLEYELVDGEVTITGYTGVDRELVIPDEIDGRPVTRIGQCAFLGYDMISIELPETLIEIEDGAFEDCDCLEQITVPDTAVVIGRGAFYHCDALKKVVLPEGLERIEAGAFNSCAVLAEINLPDGLELLGEYSLGYCPMLRTGEYRLVETVQSVRVDYGAAAITTCTEDAQMKTTKQVMDYGDEITEVYEIVETLDEKGQTVHAYYDLGEDGGVTEYTYSNEYDDEDRLIHQMMYDENGEVVNEYIWSYWDGGYSCTRQFDYEDGSVGQVVQTWNQHGELISVISSIDGETYESSENYYGNWGLMTRTVESKYTPESNQFLQMTCDAYGNVIEIYDADNELENSIEHVYDDAGNLIMSTTYDDDGEQVLQVTYVYEKVS